MSLTDKYMAVIFKADAGDYMIAAENLRTDEHSINLVSREQGRVQISIKYEKSIDLLVTTYQWKVAHTADGKDL